jgi:hypothetical protein
MKLVFIIIPLFLISMLGSPEIKSVTYTKADIGQAAQRQVPQDTSQATNLKGAVADWISALTKESGFEDWQTAKWESLPVGPGTHTWLIVIRKDHLEVGYMVVGAMEDGEHYKLLEYGLGKQPLFSLNTLHQSMTRLALIDSSLTLDTFTQESRWSKERYYLKALENFWKISRGTEIYYFDAKSGELLLNGVDPFQGSARPGQPIGNKAAHSDELTNQHSAQIKERIVSPAYDPSDKLSWINGKALTIHSLPNLKLALKQHPQMTFMAEVYQPKIIYPFALLGYQVWSNGEAYTALDDHGARYIPLSSLLGSGSFYP